MRSFQLPALRLLLAEFIPALSLTFRVAVVW